MGPRWLNRLIDIMRARELPQPPPELAVEQQRLRSAVQKTHNVAGALDHTARNAAAKSRAFDRLMEQSYDDIEARLRRR